MANEIERKFLVSAAQLQDAIESGKVTSRVRIKQGYLSMDPERTVRVRIESVPAAYRDIQRAWMTVKGKSTEDGVSRKEWEYPINVEDAEEMLGICKTVIEKVRLTVGRFTIDIFDDESIPSIAEIELSSPEEVFDKPEWLGVEVTGDPRYYNSQLANGSLQVSANQLRFLQVAAASGSELEPSGKLAGRVSAES